MPAYNLLYVVNDNAFDCFNLVTGRTKIRYMIAAGGTLPLISDTLQSGTILVLGAHCTANGRISYNGVFQNASAYANTILGRIQYSNRITKIVYFACTANPGFAAIANISQVMPNDVLTLVGGNSLRVGANNTAVSVNNAVATGATANGWVYH